jgi:hypothetical protein
LAQKAIITLKKFARGVTAKNISRSPDAKWPPQNRFAAWDYFNEVTRRLRLGDNANNLLPKLFTMPQSPVVIRL